MGARGERTIRAGGREVPVLFTYRALVDAEKRLGKPILSVVEGFTSGSSGLTETITLLHVGMEAARVDGKQGGLPVSLKDAYRVMDEAGFAEVAGPVMAAVADVIGYSGDGSAGEGEPDPNA